MAAAIKMPQIYTVACHTDHVGVGSTFVAIKGMKDDGIQHITVALEKGATTIIVEKSSVLSPEMLNLISLKKAELVLVENSRAALAQLSAKAAGYPARSLRIVGVTGTKGKTTSSFLLDHVLQSAGLKTALLSTVHNKIFDSLIPTNLTTQHPDYLHNFFSLCVENDVDIVIMEVAAQATTLHRIDGLEFDGLIFTNFAQEHGEFYATIDEYFASKVAIIEQVKVGAPLLLNADDERVASLSKIYAAALLFGIQNKSVHYQTVIKNNDLSMLELQIFANQGNDFTVKSTSLVGDYNAYNILGVVSLCLELGLNPQTIAQAVATFGSVPGRLERFSLSNGASCFIDYAHNPSSYRAVLSMMRLMTSQLIVVFGCGGDRDATKRPLMGAIASEIADLVIITTDNPRSEHAEDIAADILEGIDHSKRSQVICQLDREQAIKTAYAHSKAGSIIMLLGKGPDQYQLIGSKKIPFSEKAIVQSLP